MNANQYAQQVIKELSTVLPSVHDREVEQLVDEIERASSVFVAGAGRSGLMAKAFAMRLLHMGRQVYVVGETTTPNITDQDLLIVGSGSGATESLVAIAQRAKNKFNARLALVTIFPDSPIGQLADVKIRIAAPTPKTMSNQQVADSIQPMGSLFEQSLLLLLDIIVLCLMERAGQSSSTMFTRHANLE